MATCEMMMMKMVTMVMMMMVVMTITFILVNPLLLCCSNAKTWLLNQNQPDFSFSPQIRVPNGHFS